MGDRWPKGWFERLMLQYKLNSREYADYAATFTELGLKPDPKLREDYTDASEKPHPSRPDPEDTGDEHY